MQRYDHFYAQLLTEAELDADFQAAEQADWDIVGDHGLLGITSGLVVAENNPTPDLTVDISAGNAYDSDGKRIRIGSTQNLNLSVDHLGADTSVASGGNSKIISIFLEFERLLTDPRADGNSMTVYYNRAESFAFYVVQGAEATSGTESAPALETGKVLLADVTITNAQTQILDADIDMTTRSQKCFVASAGSLEVDEGTGEEAIQALLTLLNNHVTQVGAAHTADAIDTSIAATWHDGATIAGTDADAVFEEIVTDLVNAAGSDRIGGAAHTSASSGGVSLSAGSIQDQLRELSDGSVSVAGAQSISGVKTFGANAIFSSTSQHTGTSTFTGALTLSGASSGIRYRTPGTLGDADADITVASDTYYFTVPVVSARTFTLRHTGTVPDNGQRIRVTMTVDNSLGGPNAIFKREDPTELATIDGGGNGGWVEFEYLDSKGWFCIGVGGDAVMTIPH